MKALRIAMEPAKCRRLVTRKLDFGRQTQGANASDVRMVGSDHLVALLGEARSCKTAPFRHEKHGFWATGSLCLHVLDEGVCV